MQMQVARKQQGFTIIELVVVILLLGILAATALPRFIDVTDEAHDAAFDGVLGGFTTGVALFRAQYVASGQPASVTLDNATLNFNTSTGYPRIHDEEGVAVATVAAITDDIAVCLDVFNNVLQSGRPTITFADTTNAVGIVPLSLIAPPTGNTSVLEDGLADIEDQTSDFQVGLYIGTAEAPADSGNGALPVCYYAYTGQFSNAVDAVAAGRDGVPFFTYSPNGAIRVGYFNETEAVFTR